MRNVPVFWNVPQLEFIFPTFPWLHTGFRFWGRRTQSKRNEVRKKYLHTRGNQILKVHHVPDGGETNSLLVEYRLYRVTNFSQRVCAKGEESDFLLKQTKHSLRDHSQQQSTVTMRTDPMGSIQPHSCLLLKPMWDHERRGMNST